MWEQLPEILALVGLAGAIPLARRVFKVIQGTSAATTALVQMTQATVDDGTSHDACRARVAELEAMVVEMHRIAVSYHADEHSVGT